LADYASPQPMQKSRKILKSKLKARLKAAVNKRLTAGCVR
jgi:hypothetical protein